MFKKFDSKSYRWDQTDTVVYKKDTNLFRDVTKQILFEREGDLPVQLRYFQVEPGGWSSFERHEHMHAVVIFRGAGHALVGHDVYEVHEGDFLSIPPWAWHQFKADMGEALGFLCLVNADRDRPSYPTEADKEALRQHPEAAAFLDRS